MSESKTYTVRRDITVGDLNGVRFHATCTLTAVSTGRPIMRVVATARAKAEKPFTASEEALAKATDLLHAALAAQDDLWVLAEDGAQA